MIRRLLILAFFLPTVAFAAVEVRSGEHADFSRLVFQFDSSPDWQMGKVDGGYELRLQNADTNIDFSRVFDFIPRTRITGISITEKSHIFIATDCICFGDAFVMKEGRLVIDIKDGAPTASSQFEVPFPGPMLKAVVVQLPELLQSPEPDPIDQQLNPIPSPKPDPTPMEPMSVADIPFSGAFQEWKYTNIAETQATLLMQMSKAAAAGMVIADISLPEIQIGHHKENMHVSAPMPEVPPLNDHGSMAVDIPSHMNVETAVDRARSEFTRPNTTLTNSAECLSDEVFDLHMEDQPNIEQGSIGDLRASLVLEFDLPNKEAVMALVTRYLYLGFGAEAIALLDSMDIELPHANEQRLMADLIDHGKSQRPNLFATQATCATDAAMWAVIADPMASAKKDINTSAVIQTFSELPQHLRRHIGSVLSQRFLDMGDISTATIIRNIIAREPEIHDAKFTILQAQLDVNLDQIDDAVEKLETSIAEGGPMTTKTVMALIETEISAGRNVDKETADLARALAYEHRGSETGRELAVVAIRGLLASEEIEQGFLAIEVALEYGDISIERAATLQTEAHRLNVENSDDIAFLQLTFAQNGLGAAVDSNTEVLRSVSSRLVDLGFTKKAKKILTMVAQTADHTDHMLLAQIAIAENEPRVAKFHLAKAEQNQEEVALLLAQANELSHDLDKASQYYQTAGYDTLSQNTAWRSGDRGRILAGGSDIHAEASNHISPPESVPAGHLENANRTAIQSDPIESATHSIPRLATGQQLLKKSQETRDLVERLLANTE